jgi:hypothetical protein
LVSAFGLAAFAACAGFDSWSITILELVGGVSAGSPDEYFNHCLPSK